MELGLSLGEAFMAAEKAVPAQQLPSPARPRVPLRVGSRFLFGQVVALERRETKEKEDDGEDVDEEEEVEEEEEADDRSFAQPSPHLQLSLLPFSPVPRRSSPVLGGGVGLSWPSSETRNASITRRGFDVNQPPTSAEEMEEEEEEEAAAATAAPAAALSSSSSFQMEFSAGLETAETGAAAGGAEGGQLLLLPATGEAERAASSRGSDEEENGAARKKLRLSKDQSAFLEESFKEHSTLNPKQKLSLSKQLNLRPRQVEVWFQNRRARTKLKQTEVDCEYLKRCCETLTEENRRLQKELSELRALKSTNPFLMHLPATTLSMCPSCERVASTTTPPQNTTAAAISTTSNASAAAAATTNAPVSSAGAKNVAVTAAAAAAAATAADDHRPNSFASLFSKPGGRRYPFASSLRPPPQQLQQPSTTS